MSNGFDAPWDSIIEQAHISEFLFTRFGVKMQTVTSLLMHVVCSASVVFERHIVAEIQMLS